MKHIINKGENEHVIMTLHGTGGSATDLFDIANILDPLATKIGFEGRINENGMRRFFKRYPQGGFDLENLDLETEFLYKEMLSVLKANNLENKTVTVIGYSNGANIAKNIIKKYENVKFNNVVLFHPSAISPGEAYSQQPNLNMLITFGKNDPYITEAQFLAMEAMLKQAKINVTSYAHSHGHQLISAELEQAKLMLEKGFNNE